MKSVYVVLDHVLAENGSVILKYGMVSRPTGVEGRAEVMFHIRSRTELGSPQHSPLFQVRIAVAGLEKERKAYTSEIVRQLDIVWIVMRTKIHKLGAQFEPRQGDP
jgi:hypothetical protein